MPKTAESDASKCKRIACQFPQEFKVTPRNELFCVLCECPVKYAKQFMIDSHRKSAKHSTKLQRTTSSSSVPTSSKHESQTFLNFKPDLAKHVTTAFLAADIPLHKLEHQAIRDLFDFMGHHCPSESSCRQHVPKLFQLEQQKIFRYVNGEKIFIMVDETEISGRKFMNILVGILEKPEVTYLYDCRQLEGNINHQTVCHAIDDVVKDLNVHRNNFLLLLSDAARYMTLAGKTLKSMYPSLFHVTCMAHLLHNCALLVKSKYEAVDSLISSIKAATIKSGDRRLLFASIGSPPKPVVTRWGTWLNAAFWYADHFSDVKQIVLGFEDDGLLVSRAKSAVSSTVIVDQLVDVATYRPLHHLMERCEGTNYNIRQVIQDVNSLDFGIDPCEIKSYINLRLSKNDIIEIVNLARDDISPAEYNLLLCAQSTTAAIERSFSQLKNLLRFNRNFSPANIKYYAIMNYNASNN